MGLHELPALERFYIGAAQIEPFPVLAFLIKSLVPIRLDTDGIIGTDDMHSNGLLGQLYRKFVFTTASRVAPANFVVAPRLDQIDKPKIFRGFDIIVGHGSCTPGSDGTKRDNIIVSFPAFAVRLDACDELLF